jgi:hypothetical protein
LPELIEDCFHSLFRIHLVRTLLYLTSAASLPFIRARIGHLNTAVVVPYVPCLALPAAPVKSWATMMELR